MENNRRDASTPLPYTRIGLVFLFALVCASCQTLPPDDTSQKEKGPDLTKDLVTFILPKIVTDASPVAQDHFNHFLPYNTIRHQMKPRSVFIDRTETIVAPISALVTRLNFIHVIYDREGARVWNGSLFYGVNESPLVATSEGFHFGVKSTSQAIEVSFQDGDFLIKKHLNIIEDAWHVIEEGDRKVAFFHYVFPSDSQAQTP